MGPGLPATRPQRSWVFWMMAQPNKQQARHRCRQNIRTTRLWRDRFYFGLRYDDVFGCHWNFSTTVAQARPLKYANCGTASKIFFALRHKIMTKRRNFQTSLRVFQNLQIRMPFVSSVGHAASADIQIQGQASEQHATQRSAADGDFAKTSPCLPPAWATLLLSRQEMDGEKQMIIDNKKPLPSNGSVVPETGIEPVRPY